jgi:hypothetical protein
MTNNNHHNTTTTPEQREWRRSKILALLAEGRTQAEIATEMHLPKQTVSYDVKALRIEAKQRVQDFLDERLPFAYELSLTTLHDLKVKAYNILHNIEKEQQTKGISNPKLYMDCIRLIKEIEGEIVDVESHNGAVKSAMIFAKNAKQQLSTIENKSSTPTPTPTTSASASTAVLVDDDDDDKYKDVDVQNNNDQITTGEQEEEIVETDNDVTRPGEVDAGRESGTTAETADSATATDNTTEEDSRAF